MNPTIWAIYEPGSYFSSVAAGSVIVGEKGCHEKHKKTQRIQDVVAECRLAGCVV